LPGRRQAQPGVATGQSVLAWRLGYAEVLVSRFHLRSNSELSSVKLIQTKQTFGHVIMSLAKISGLTGAAFSLCLFVHSVFHSFRISKGFAFFDSLFPELVGSLQYLHHFLYAGGRVALSIRILTGFGEGIYGLSDRDGTYCFKCVFGRRPARRRPACSFVNHAFLYNFFNYLFMFPSAKKLNQTLGRDSQSRRQ
jgi:hypothetical protein